MIEDHIGIPDENDGVVLFGFLERVFFLFLGLLIGVLLVLVFLFLFLGSAIRKCRLEFARKPDRQRVLRSGPLKILHHVFARQIGHESIHKLRIRRALDQYRFLERVFFLFLFLFLGSAIGK